MQNTFLLRHLRRLSKQDWRELRKIVRSPWFNQREDVVRLFDYLDGALAGQQEAAVGKERVWLQVFPGQPFDEKALHYTSSFLLKTIRQYLALSEAMQDEMQQQLYLCRALRKRGLDEAFEKEMAAAETLQQKQNLRNTRYHYDRYLLEQERAALTMQQRRSGDMNLQAVHDELTTFFLAETLRQGCTVLTHQTMSKQAYDLKMLDAVLAHIDNGSYDHVPAVAVYHSAFKALAIENPTQRSGASPDSEVYFEKLKSLIGQAGGQFPQHELRDIYLLAINFCIKRLNRGEERYIREAFELYRSGLGNGILLENGILSGYTFKNVARLGAALGEHEWVKGFIENFRKHLPARERDNTWRYTLASFHFQLGQYGEAMLLLRHVEFKDVLNNLDARRMLLRSYFELGEFTALESLLDTFQAYIRRQKDIGYHRDNYLNLIRFVRQLMEVGNPDKQALKMEIQQTQNVAEKLWLLEKIGD